MLPVICASYGALLSNQVFLGANGPRVGTDGLLLDARD
jgi:hypothetical protein